MAVLALIGPLPLMHLRSMFHDLLLAQDCQATHFAVEFSDGEAAAWVMEYHTVFSVVQRMSELNVASSTICNEPNVLENGFLSKS